MYQLSSPRVNKETRNPDEKARLLNCWKKNLPFKILLKPLKIKGLKEQHQKRRKNQRGVSGKGRLDDRRDRRKSDLKIEYFTSFGDPIIIC